MPLEKVTTVRRCSDEFCTKKDTTEACAICEAYDVSDRWWWWVKIVFSVMCLGLAWFTHVIVVEWIVNVGIKMRSIPVGWLAPDLSVLYALAYISPLIRGFASSRAGTIVESLPDTRTSVTMLALIVASTALLANISSRQQDKSFESEYGWLAAAMLFALAQMLLTTQVTGWTSYFAAASIYSLWWCLAWFIWFLYLTLLPNRAWVVILGIAPVGVLLVSLLNLKSMYFHQRRWRRRSHHKSDCREGYY